MVIIKRDENKYFIKYTNTDDTFLLHKGGFKLNEKESYLDESDEFMIECWEHKGDEND